jgi:hypothetical protein
MSVKSKWSLSRGETRAIRRSHVLPSPWPRSCRLFSLGSLALSGTVLEPRALDELALEWKTMDGLRLLRPVASSSTRFPAFSRFRWMLHPLHASKKRI